MDIISYLLGKKKGGGGSGDLSKYFTPTISAGTNSTQGYAKMVKTIPETTTLEGDSLSYLFGSFQGTEIPFLDVSNAINMNYTFSTCTNITTIPLWNTGKVTSMQNTFEYCTSLVSIPKIDTKSVISFQRTFRGCTSLTTIPVLDTSSVTIFSNMFQNATSLNDTSLDNILQMCINATSYSATKTLAHMGLTSTDYPASRIEALPHYQDFINAGWTIGY